MRGGAGDGAAAILQVIASSNRRGAEVFAVDLERALTDRGRAVRTVALAPGSNHELLPVPTLGPGPRAVTTLRALRNTGRATGVVVAHGSSTLPATTAALAGTRTPFVYRNIGDPRHWSATGWRRRRTGFLLRRSRLVVALWPGAADAMVELHGVDRRRIRVIPNAVDPGGFTPADPARRRAERAALNLDLDRPTVVYIGSLSGEKRADLAIEAIAAVPGAQLLIVGDGPLATRLRALTAGRAPGRVHFAGTLAEPARALAAADVLVLPSDTEGLPAVLIEAGLMALPVVATDVGGVREIVEPDETGVLVPPDDRLALVHAIRSTLADPGGLGAAARRRCLARFAIHTVAEAWDGALADVPGATTQRRPAGLARGPA